MMDFETDLVVAVPHWKVEFIERKLKRSKGDEVPQWKRELLKRIHSKNQRMIEQQQADILEEHIPKVSNNIFLIHEKQHYTRFPSAPKTITPEISPTSHPPTLLTLSVDNVIIIEKETTNVADEVISPSSSDSVFETIEEDKEYPKAGIVHRLLGRFQAEKSKAAKKTLVFAETYQQSKTTDWNKTAPRPITPPPTPTPQSTPVEEKPPPVPTSPASPQSYIMPSDMLTPLLISSAKPFSRQSMNNAADHGYHHVNVPTRKVSSPTNPKYTNPSKTDNAHTLITEAPAKPEASKPVVIIEAKQVEHEPLIKLNSAPPPEVEPERSPAVSSFTEDLSSLHSNREFFIPPVQEKETIIMENETALGNNNALKRITLTNGETLHSSGNEVRPQVRSADGFETKLQDKSNFKSFSSDVKIEKSQDEIKLIVDKAQKPDLDISKKEILLIQKEPELSETTERRSDSELKLFMKENTVPVSKRQDTSESQFKQVVNESLDESTLKTKAAKAANRIMQNSKTLKITPSKTTQEKKSGTTHESEQSLSASTPKDEADTLFSRSVHQQDDRVASKRHEVVKIEAPDSRTVQELPPVKPPSNIPTTCIDDLVDGPSSDAVTITPVSSLLSSPKEEKKEENTVDTKPAVSTVLKITSQPQKENKAPKTQNSYINRTSPNSISTALKSEPTQKPVSFGAKQPSAGGRGKSFVIDPSKFRKSSAQPPVVTAASRAMQEAGNTRMIVPGGRPLNATDVDFSGEQPKTGKRKVTVDQITVIGGYVSLERSCLAKESKSKKSVTLSFSEKKLETAYTYVSEKSLLEEDTAIEFKKATKSPGFGKDSTIGKYTPKYLLSMKVTEIVEEDDVSQSKSVYVEKKSNYASSQPSDATPDDNAAAWSDTTSSSTDILF